MLIWYSNTLPLNVLCATVLLCQYTCIPLFWIFFINSLILKHNMYEHKSLGFYFQFYKSMRKMLWKLFFDEWKIWNMRRFVILYFFHSKQYPLIKLYTLFHLETNAEGTHLNTFCFLFHFATNAKVFICNNIYLLTFWWSFINIL